MYSSLIAYTQTTHTNTHKLITTGQTHMEYYTHRIFTHTKRLYAISSCKFHVQKVAQFLGHLIYTHLYSTYVVNDTSL